MIAFAGKGSSGKSTIAALALSWLLPQLTYRPLVIDADPHQSLGTLLSVTPPATLGSLRSQYERALLTFPLPISVLSSCGTLPVCE